MRSKFLESALFLALYIVGVKLWFTISNVVPELTVSTALAFTLGSLTACLLPFRFRYRPATT